MSISLDENEEFTEVGEVDVECPYCRHRGKISLDDAKHNWVLVCVCSAIVSTDEAIRTAQKPFNEASK